ncbi:leucine-rich repeat domain-containing protein [Pseudomonadota bacterium]
MVGELDSINLREKFKKSGFLGKVGLTEASKKEEGHFSLRTKNPNQIYNHNYLSDQQKPEDNLRPSIKPDAIHITKEGEGGIIGYTNEELVDTGTKQEEMFEESVQKTQKEQTASEIPEVSKIKEEFISPISDLATIRPYQVIKDMDLNIDEDQYICPDKKIENKELSKLLHEGKYKYLDLSYCSAITDFSDLKHQTDLVQLSLSGNKNLEDCSFLSELKDLEVLDIGMTGVMNLSFIKNLKKLKILNIKFTEIRDISPVSNLPDLRDFTIMGCSQINDISSLQHNKELRLIDANDALNVRDISFVKYLDKIENLFFDYCPLRSIESIRELHNLRLFSFQSKAPHIKNIADYFENLTEMRFLNLRRTGLNNINGLRKLTKMIGIDVGYGNFVDVEPLSNMTEMKRAIVDENPGIVDISSLENLKKLDTLDISGDRISDISVLRNFTKLGELELDNNVLLKDLRPLENLVNISELSMSGCLNLSDIYPIRNMKKLMLLMLNKCPRIKDISVLRYLPELIVVDLDSTSIPYEQISNLKNCGILSAFSTIGSSEHYRRAKNTFALRRKWNRWRKVLGE